MKTLHDKIGELAKGDKGMVFNSLVEDYLENEGKYHNALMTHSQLMICDLHGINITEDEAKIAEDAVFKLVRFFKDKSDKAKKDIDVILSKINLDNISVYEYKEFDRFEICVDNDGWYVKYKPKNVPVSFWRANAKVVKIT